MAEPGHDDLPLDTPPSLNADRPSAPISSSRSHMDCPSSMPCIVIRDLSVSIHQRQVLDYVNLAITRNRVTAIIGPTGTGKSTLLRCLNRMNDFVDGLKTTGEIFFEGSNIQDSATDVSALRRRVAHVDERWTTFPTTVFDNVAFGLRMAGVRSAGALRDAVRLGMQRAGLWDELQRELNEQAAKLTTGQRYRLCMARALAMQPDVMLLDEPGLTLDPGATARVEDVVFELKSMLTIVTVTNSVEQAARISDDTAFLLDGRLVEAGTTTDVFTNPRDARTEDYVRGRFG